MQDIFIYTDLEKKSKEFIALYPCVKPGQLDITFLSKTKEILSCMEFDNKSTPYEGYREHVLYGIDRMRINVLKQDKTIVFQLMDIISKSKTIFTRTLMVNLMYGLEKQFDKLEFNCNRGYLRPKECALILNEKFPDVQIDCGGYDDLKLIIDDMTTNNTRGEVIYILKPSYYEHILPLFLQRNGAELEIICTDSVGGHEKGWIKEIVHRLSSEDNICAKFYYLEITRQFDPKNCSIFTLSDIKNFLKLKKAGIDSFAHVRKNSCFKSIEQGLQVFAFRDVPPCMMKLTQSTTTISEYLAVSPQYAKEIVGKKRYENLLESINLNTLETIKDKKIKEVNYRADFKFARYCNIIAKKILTDIDQGVSH